MVDNGTTETLRGKLSVVDPAVGSVTALPSVVMSDGLTLEHLASLKGFSPEL
jgi:hypothetical protein